MRSARSRELVLEGPPPGGRAEAVAPTRPALHQEFSRFEVTDTTSFPNRTHGRVFFTLPGEGDFTCSGTVVTANSHSVVLTAGHCVHAGGPGGGFATNWIFVPGYRDGARPFGEWPAASLAATTGWVGAANLSFDVGAAVVPRIATGQGIQDVVGARGITFDRPRDQLYRSFGYPAGQPALGFDGEREFACDSRYGGDDEDTSAPQAMVIGCDMNAGASGGAWVIDESLVNSVSSYKYPLEPDHPTGPTSDPRWSASTRPWAAPRSCAGVTRSPSWAERGRTRSPAPAGRMCFSPAEGPTGSSPWRGGIEPARGAAPTQSWLRKARTW
jgi:hypothetical protein